MYLFETTPFWDDLILTDKRLVFGNSNPINFWYWYSGINKAWPMAYFINWLASIFPVYQFLILKAVLIVFHSLNTLLIYKILSNQDAELAKLSCLFFLIHPFHFLTLSWTFQVFSVVAVFFILLLIYQIFFAQKQNGPIVVFIFYISLAIKSLGIGLVFLPFLKKNMKIKRKAIYIGFFIVLAGYFFYMLNSGIATYAIENIESKKLVPMAPMENEMVLKENPFSKSPSIESSLTEWEKGLFKTTVVLNNFWYYFKNTILFIDNSIIQKKETYISISTYLSASILVLGICFVVHFVFLGTNQNLFLGLGSFIFMFGFLPISGVVYVPHFKHSFTSGRFHQTEPGNFMERSHPISLNGST